MLLARNIVIYDYSKLFLKPQAVTLMPDNRYPFFSIYSAKQSCLLMLALLLVLSGCQSTPNVTTTPSYASSTQADKRPYIGKTHTLAKLYQQHDTWHGTPYRLGGMSRTGIDCSAFVQMTFNKLFDIKLPRTTSQQIHSGKRIGRSDLRAGDLIFFRDGRHVGIYLEDDRFLHASTRLGITISRMDNVYWSRYYWRSIRVMP